MTAPQLAPQPLPKISFPASVAQQVAKRVAGESSSGGGEPPRSLAERLSNKAPASNAEVWQAALTNWVRLALVVPVLALIVVLVGSDEAGIGDFKFKATGIREVVTIATALLIMKLLRDASRILAMFRISELSIDLSDASKAESYINAAYARPVDLFRARHSQEHLRVLGLLSAERIRSFLLWIIAILAGLAVLAALGKAISDMVAKPVLAPPMLSYGLAALATALLAAATLDLFMIIVARWPRLAAKRQRMNDWKRAVASCEREAVAVELPVPSLWPPLGETQLASFRKQIELYKIAERCEREAPRGESTYSSWQNLPEPWPVSGPYRYAYLYGNLPGQAIKSESERRQAAMAAYKQLDKEIKEADYLPDAPIVYIDERRDNTDADTVEKHVAEMRAEFSRIKIQFAAIRWCKDQAPQLNPPVYLPLYWNYDDLDAVADVMFEILFSRWKEKGEFWSERTHTWVKFRSGSARARLWLKVIAGFRTLKLVARSPNPPLALKAFYQGMQQQEWMAYLSQFEIENERLEPAPSKDDHLI